MRAQSQGRSCSPIVAGGVQGPEDGGAALAHPLPALPMKSRVEKQLWECWGTAKPPKTLKMWCFMSVSARAPRARIPGRDIPVDMGLGLWDEQGWNQILSIPVLLGWCTST